MRVMMSAAGSPVAAGIIRHLQGLGHYVIGHDCIPCGIGFKANEFYISPTIDSYPVEYLNFIDSHMPDCDVYLPFLDEELRLPDFSIIAGVNTATPAETLRVFTSKNLQHYAMERARLPVPDWAVIGDIIVKPEFGRGGKGQIRLNNPDLATYFAEEMGYHTERFIDGDEYTVDVLTDLTGKFLYAVPRLRLVANGVSIVGRIVVDAEIINLARDVVSEFDFRGPINIQIIRQKETRKLYIIEVNPRLSGSCMFTVMAGFDILNATIRLHLGLPFDPPEKVKEITVRRHYVEEFA